MIISSSRRTDIPAFYSDWFMNRIKEEYVLVRNPWNPHQISRISLAPSAVDCIVFWTKNPENLIDKIPGLSKYNFYFQFTITPYDKRIEPNIASKERVMEVFKIISGLIGPNRLIWRYDPILITDEISIERHIAWFKEYAESLTGFTKRCIISFIDRNNNNNKNLRDIRIEDFSDGQMKEIAGSFVEVANKCGMVIETCAEKIDLKDCGVAHGACIDGKFISEITGRRLDGKKDKGQRPACGCITSTDIGAYNTCPHGCIYCYANSNANTVRENYAIHNPRSPLIYGEVGPKDRITEREMK